jgi:hypothetical protein
MVRDNIHASKRACKAVKLPRVFMFCSNRLRLNIPVKKLIVRLPKEFFVEKHGLEDNWDGTHNAAVQSD